MKETEFLLRRMTMKKLIAVLVPVLMITGASARAATLDRGISIGSIFVAGGSANGSAMIVQLKYQMAVDSKIGIKNRYRTIYTTNAYHNYFYDSHDTTTVSYDSHDTIISVNADIGEGEIILNTNPIIYKDNASHTLISVDAEIGKGEITLKTK